MADRADGRRVNLDEHFSLSVVIPTRGDVDMEPTLRLFREWVHTCDDIVVWDNSLRGDAAVYGRYAAIAEAKHNIIVTVDDDIVAWPALLNGLALAYEPGVVTCNMPQQFRKTGFYDDHALVGFGAIFDRDLPDQAFRRFLDSGVFVADAFADERWFDRTCDVVFTGLTPRKLVDLPYTNREFASAPNRMWRQPDHVGERTRMLDLVRRVAA
jgi:hypothetical protein